MYRFTSLLILLAACGEPEPESEGPLVIDVHADEEVEEEPCGPDDR
ncbi:MAG: hypothetical protein OER88_13050 [Planctomycetota bacterium]|nr:hypothetical protein [Planctomycetota bacterium]